MLVQVLSTRWPREDVIGALSRVDRICRGPKPVSALRALGLQPSLVVPEPNTWHDLLQLLDRERPVSGKRVAVQEYGTRNQALLDALAERGAAVTPVPLYGWTLPEDTAPLRSAIARALAGELDAALFTSAVQIEHLFRLAAEEGHREALRDALSQQMVVASIGPITTEALALEGITADVTPEHPKMGHLVSALAQQAEAVLLRKRVGRS
jgi:uroporphyrinogen-III synthase